ncbi:hypothetical protein K502DRAFT_323880, partial [Neoconidiobolus thromboides FSU 785]
MTNLQLKVATSFEDILQTFKTVYQQWGSEDYTIEQFIEREILSRNETFIKNNIKSYLLLNENEKVVSQCEVISRQVYYKDLDGYKELQLNCLASVFTIENERKKGYAEVMINKVLTEMDRKENNLMMLFSDVDNYYERMNFQLQLPFHVQFDNTSVTKIQDKNLKYLNQNQIEQLTTIDCQLSKERIQQLNDEKLLKEGVFIVEPNFITYKWHWLRSDFYNRHHNIDLPKVYAIEYLNEFMIFDYDFKLNQLNVIRYNINQYANPLIQASLNLANELKLSLIIWNFNISLLNDELRELGIKVIRKHTLPHVRFNHSNLPICYELHKYIYC